MIEQMTVPAFQDSGEVTYNFSQVSHEHGQMLLILGEAAEDFED